MHEKLCHTYSSQIRLAEGDISTAVSLYRQSGSKQLKTALKLASSGNVAELLSFLQVLYHLPGTLEQTFQVVFCSRSLHISQAERIHLSNLALLAYCQQTLTKPALSRWFCFFKIYHFAYLCVPGTTLMPAFCHSSLKMCGELFILVDVSNLG